MKKELLIVLLTCAGILFGQESKNTYIRGTVTDKEYGEPLVGANVIIRGTNYGTSTDKQGHYQLDISKIESGSYKVGANYIGYHDHYVNIEIPVIGNNEIDFILKESALTMDQIVVTGTRSERLLKHAPVTTQVIKKETITESGAADLSELLTQVTGASVTANAFGTGISTVDLQGFGSEHVMILVDGVKMIGRIEGRLDIGQIPVSQIERIEIVKGATSTLYGSEAMGGVINIITQAPAEEWHFSSGVQVGEYGRLNSDVAASGQYGGWQPVLNLSYHKFDGFDLDKSTDQEDGTHFDKYQGQLKLQRAFNENMILRLQTLYFEEEQSIISSSIFKDIILNDNNANRVEFDFRYPVGHIKTGVEYSAYNHRFDRYVLSSGFLKKGSNTEESLLKGDLLFDNTYGDHKLNGGYAFEKEKIISDRVTGGERSTTLHNVFLQDEIHLSQLFTTVLGARLDAHSIYGEELTPKASLMISPLYNMRVRMSYGRGFRAPSFKELYIDFNNLSVNYYAEGNENLKPETSDAYNLGLEYWTDNNYHTRVNFYYNKIKNLIEYEYKGIKNGFAYFQTANFLSAETWGAEWDMEYYPSSWLEIATGYNYMGSKNETTGDPLPLKPEHTINFRMVLKFPGKINLTINSQYYGRKFYVEDETIAGQPKEWISAYGVVNANLNFPLITYFDGHLGVKNINDYVDRTWGPMPGREFYGGIKFSM